MLMDAETGSVGVAGVRGVVVVVAEPVRWAVW